MNRLRTMKSLLSLHWVALLGACLCLYFSYHLFNGQRSYIRLVSFETSIEMEERKYASLNKERLALEAKVKRLRPDQLDKTLLRERAEHMLGYYGQDHYIIITE